MVVQRTLIVKLLGIVAVSLITLAPAWWLHASREVLTRFTISEWFNQVVTLFTGRLGLTTFTPTEIGWHIVAIVVWVSVAVLWIMLVVTPVYQAGQNLRRRGEPPSQFLEEKEPVSRWSLRAATWMLSLALFGVAGQSSAAENTYVEPNPVVLQTNIVIGADSEQPDGHLSVPARLSIREGDSIGGALERWLESTFPETARAVSDSDLEVWARNVMAQNPNPNWSESGHVQNVSGLMIRIGTLPIVGAPPINVQTTVTNAVADLLAGDVSWEEYQETSASEAATGLKATDESARVLEHVALQEYTVVPAGAPTVETWQSTPTEEDAHHKTFSIAWVGAGLAVVAGALWRRLQVFQAAGRHNPEIRAAVENKPGDAEAIAALGTLASHDLTEMRSAVAKSVAWSADHKKVPSMTALMINPDDGDLYALLIPGDEARPRQGTPWERNDDDPYWHSTIEKHWEYPHLIDSLATQMDPYPCLVSLGDFPEGQSLWLDMEVFNNIQVGVRQSGNRGAMEEEEVARLGLSTMWSWAVELLSGAGAGAEVIVAGFGEDLKMLGARYYPSLDKDAMSYIARRLRDHHQNNRDILLEGRPASQLRMLSGSSVSLAPLIVFMPFPPEGNEQNDSKLWESANFFDRRVLTCVFGYTPQAVLDDPSTPFAQVAVEPDPNGGSGSYLLSVDQPKLVGLRRQLLDSETQKAISRVISRHYRAITKPSRKPKQADLAVANVSIPSEAVVAAAVDATQPGFFHLKLLGEPQLHRSGALWPLIPSDREMLCFLAAARRPLNRDELSWVAGHNPTVAERMFVLARSNLGHDPQGRLFLGHETYEIATPQFTCDIYQLDNLYAMLTQKHGITDPTERGRAAKEALGLVDGHPFGSYASQWTWTHSFPNATWELVWKIDNLVHSYAQSAADNKNWHEVMWATSRGIRANSAPCRLCYELAAEAAEQSGQHEIAQLVRTKLHQKLVSQDFYLPEAAVMAVAE